MIVLLKATLSQCSHLILVQKNRQFYVSLNAPTPNTISSHGIAFYEPGHQYGTECI